MSFVGFLLLQGRIGLDLPSNRKEGRMDMICLQRSQNLRGIGWIWPIVKRQCNLRKILPPVCKWNCKGTLLVGSGVPLQASCGGVGVGVGIGGIGVGVMTALACMGGIVVALFTCTDIYRVEVGVTTTLGGVDLVAVAVFVYTDIGNR